MEAIQLSLLDLPEHCPDANATSSRYKHGFEPGDSVRVLLGRGKHSDKITTVAAVTAKEIITSLGTFKPSALVKYFDRTVEMKALGMVPGAKIQTSDGTVTEIICTFADGRVLASGRYYQYKQVHVVHDTLIEQKTDTRQKSKSGWDISPQCLSTTVKRHKIAVHFEDRGNEYFFSFRGKEGSISSSGFYSELVSERSKVRREYLNPGVWADFKAEELYRELQLSKQYANYSSKQHHTPQNLKEVRSAKDIDALIDIIGIASVCRMYVSAPSTDLDKIGRGR